MPDPLLCVCCQQVEPDNPPVCTRDRLRLAQALWELRDLHQLLPYALPPGRGELVRVGGTRERQLPLRTDVHDLAAAATSTPVLDHDHDQVGAVAVASILDSWAQDWASHLGEALPDPSVDALVSWLSRRLPWALDNHPAIDEFAKEITLTLYDCRSVLSVSRRPEYSPLACPGCGTAALSRNSGDPSWRCAECKAEVEVEREDKAMIVATYYGPALLVVGDDEMMVHADLSVEQETLRTMGSNYERPLGPKSWGGSIDNSLRGPIIEARGKVGVLRLPDGREGKVFVTEMQLLTNRPVEWRVQGEGPAPFGAKE
jgi:hypothetical protein